MIFDLADRTLWWQAAIAEVFPDILGRTSRGR